MTVAEAASALSLSEAGVRYLIRAGRLRAVQRKGRSWEYFIKPGDLWRIKRAKRGRPCKT